jgi:aminomethyltransferase
MKRSPLDSVHRALGAKMVPFGGWEMPLEYTGTIEEHMACRQSAVMFDVSHLGTVRVSGDHAYELLQQQLTNDLDKIGPGRAQYTHLLDDADGSVLDDIIVWWHPGSEPVFDVMPNASNTSRVVDAIGGVDTTSERAVIAVQGPNARDLVAGVFPEAATVGRFKVAEGSWNSSRCVIAGTGYTGEPGIEVAVPNEGAASLWEALYEVGVRPAGLGARDTLRLEAGLPLHGHELGAGITPLQAGLGWVIGWEKSAFRGKQALNAERQRGVARVLVGVVTDGRRPPRADCRIVRDGQDVGVVTSGNFSPVLGHGIALGFVAPENTVGDDVSIEVRGTMLTGRIAPTPFVRH